MSGNSGFDSTTAKNKNFLLTEDGNSDLSLGTSDFTVEGWFWTSIAADVTQDYQSIISDSIYSSNYSWSFYIYQDEIKLWTCTTSCSALITGGSISSNTWHHFAWTRIGGTSRVFIDGSLIGSAADTTNYGDDRIMIGANKWSTAKPYGYYGINDGYISNIRICKGKALYVNAFTPPTRQLEVTPETVLLCCQSSQDPTKEETGKLLEFHKVGDAPGPVASTFVPDVGNDHTHGTVLEGNVEFSSLNYMTLPRGTTAQRANSRGRAVIAGGYNPAGSPNAAKSLNTIEYIEINTTGHAKDFGDLSYGSASGGTCSSSTRAVTGGSYVAPSITGSLNTMSYFTIASTGNGTNFGDLTVARGYVSSLSSDTRGIWAGGAGGPSSPYIQSDVSVTDYVTIASEGDATSFGELIDQGYMGDVACSSPTRGVIAGGNPTTNVIQYVTIASTGVAKDFGDLIAANAAPGAASSSTRGIFCGSSPGAPAYTSLNHIDYLTIATTGNAKDFGDSLFAGYYKTGTSNSIRAVWTGTYQTPAKLNTIEYAQIQTLGNTVDFGDSTMTYSNRAGATSDTHGGLA